MVVNLQYDMFEDNSDMGLMKKELKLTQEECDRVRKGLFRRWDDQGKTLLKMQLEIEALKNQLMIVAKSK